MLKLKQKVEFDGKIGYIIGMDIDPWEWEDIEKISDKEVVYVIRDFSDDSGLDYLRFESGLKVIK